MIHTVRPMTSKVIEAVTLTCFDKSKIYLHSNLRLEVEARCFYFTAIIDNSDKSDESCVDLQET